MIILTFILLDEWSFFTFSSEYLLSTDSFSLLTVSFLACHNPACLLNPVCILAALLSVLCLSIYIFQFKFLKQVYYQRGFLAKPLYSRPSQDWCPSLPNQQNSGVVWVVWYRVFCLYSWLWFPLCQLQSYGRRVAAEIFPENSEFIWSS